MAADLLTADMRAFTHRSGLFLADAYTGQPGVSSRMGAAFSTLVEALHRPHTHAADPRPQNTSRCFSGMDQAMPTLIKTDTGADVLVISDWPRGAR